MTPLPLPFHFPLTRILLSFCCPRYTFGILFDLFKKSSIEEARRKNEGSRTPLPLPFHFPRSTNESFFYCPCYTFGILFDLSIYLKKNSIEEQDEKNEGSRTPLPLRFHFPLTRSTNPSFLLLLYIIFGILFDLFSFKKSSIEEGQDEKNE